ncbi:hypothetical protein, partial [Escherichia coli]
MTISNSNLLKPFITGTELPPFKENRKHECNNPLLTML